MSRNLFLGLLAAFFVSLTAAAADAESLSGIVIDDSQAELAGSWTESKSVRPFVGDGYRHDGAESKGEKAAVYRFRVGRSGAYQVLVSYSPGGNRSPNTPVTVSSGPQSRTVEVDQRKAPLLVTGFQPLGSFELSADEESTVRIETTGTTQHVIIDAVRILTAEEFTAAQQAEKRGKPAPKVVNKPAPKEKDQPKAVETPREPFVRRAPASPAARLTPARFDRLLGVEQTTPLDDIAFLRRLSLDLVGRQPTLGEYRDFLADASGERRRRAVDRYLASPQWGRNWANYWSDMIGARQDEPQLTFLNYDPFRQWLGEQLNAGVGWDELAYQMVTAEGLIGDDPAGTFVGFHQGDRNKLAGETARVFLGVRIACAQCHDHPFVDMPQETFHGMAAFYARLKVDLPWNDSDKIKISDSGKGEHKMPGSKEMIAPVVYEGEPLELGLSDRQRRDQLGRWLVAPENPWFARSFVNHVQARLLGRGFYDPVDDLGELATVDNDQAHRALAEHLVASEFDVRSVFRLIVLSDSYQSADRGPQFSGAAPKKLRADEVFDSLVTAIELPNLVGEQEEASAAVRFPPPPKSTRDLVRDAFGYDPATRDPLVTRTLQQAMLLMNNDQIQRQIQAAPGSGTILSELLEDEADDNLVTDVLYARVLARSPSDAERQIVGEHLAQAPSRQEGFEDLLWSLLNSAEFTTRH